MQSHILKSTMRWLPELATTGQVPARVPQGAALKRKLDSLKTLPKPDDGKIKLTRTSITKRIGQLFVDRASINLHSDILDHPEFFWEDDEWLPLYLRAAKYLEIDRAPRAPANKAVHAGVSRVSSRLTPSARLWSI